MSALLAYPGGKSRIAWRISRLLAPHRVYLEPFAGMASVLFAKPRVPFEIVNDADGRLMTLLRVVRDHPGALAEAIELTPYSRAEYDAVSRSSLDGCDDLEVARRVAVLVGQSFGGTGLRGSRSGWSLSTNQQRSVAAVWASLPDRVMHAAERLRGVHLENGDALTLIERHGGDEDAAIYCDPPYLAAVRNGKPMYGHELMGDDGHRSLAEALHVCSAHVLLSGYDSDLYLELFEDWEQYRISATANNQGTAGSDPARVEVLWSNRPLPVQQSFLEHFDHQEAA